MSVFGTLRNHLRRTPAPAPLATRAAIAQELEDQQDWVLRFGENGGEHGQALRGLTALPAFQQPLLDLHFELLTIGRRLEGFSQAAMVHLTDADLLTVALDMAQDTVVEATMQIGYLAQDTAAEPGGRGRGANDFQGDLSDARISARQQVLHLEELRLTLRMTESLDPESSKALDEAVTRANQVLGLLSKVGLPAPAPAG
ncbi:hypothetical protein ACEZDB_35865 [Streptacidiphilus sp. N1-3]|uniref:Uncharacterized protein n=1 Tax=Streptacidiphilus alkalitolerans TaxID=3342712 RepID=A0ABV6XCL4_9ACTN